MNAQGFFKLINNPALLNEDSLSELEKLVEAYPYVENIRILFALNLLVLDDFRYQQNLTKAAFYASDRKKLKYLVDGMKAKTEEDFSLAFKIHQETEKEVRKDELVEDAGVVEEINEEAKGDIGIEKALKGSEFESKAAKNIPENNKAESLSDAKKRIKQIRSKAELLQLVKKRLAEIEAAKKDEQVAQDEIEESKGVSDSSLIDTFISIQPSISRPDKNEFFNPQNEVVESATDEDEFFVTETLAAIHADQGNHQKAIEIYQKLSLKFPEKSSYFAARIQDLNK